METAIVTITCPHCGGQVKGIEQLAHEQKLPCTYCGTELHVPRVGDEIVREVVVQAPAAPPQFDPVYEPSLQSPNRTPQIVVALLLLVGGVIALLALRCDANDTIEKFDRDEAAQHDCEASCKQQCANAPPAHPMTPTGNDDLDRDTARTMAEADRMICETDCEQKHDCMGLHAPR